jgi:hypothetical protein
MTIVTRYILSILENKKTLENTEGAIKNGQFRETGNIGYTRQRKIQAKTFLGKYKLHQLCNG